RLAEDERCALPVKNFTPQQLARYDRPENLGQQHRLGVQPGDDLQLRQRLVEAPQDTIELKKENAQPLVFRLGAYLRLQSRQAFLQSSGLNKFGGVHKWKNKCLAGRPARHKSTLELASQAKSACFV